MIAKVRVGGRREVGFGIFVRALMLLHVVFARKGFVAGGAVDVFLARVFLAVAGGVAGCGECAMARVAGCVRAGVFFLGRLRGC